MNKETQKFDEDINFKAYEERLAGGEFDELDDDTWLAFSQGFLVAMNEDRDTIIREIEGMKLGEVFLTKVRPEKVVLQGFFVDGDGGLHRGVTTIMADALGNRYRIGLEWGTGRAFKIGVVADDEEGI